MILLLFVGNMAVSGFDHLCYQCVTKPSENDFFVFKFIYLLL